MTNIQKANFKARVQRDEVGLIIHSTKQSLNTNIRPKRTFDHKSRDEKCLTFDSGIWLKVGELSKMTAYQLAASSTCLKNLNKRHTKASSMTDDKKDKTSGHAYPAALCIMTEHSTNYNKYMSLILNRAKIGARLPHRKSHRNPLSLRIASEAISRCPNSQRGVVLSPQTHLQTQYLYRAVCRRERYHRGSNFFSVAC